MDNRGRVVDAPTKYPDGNSKSSKRTRRGHNTKFLKNFV